MDNRNIEMGQNTIKKYKTLKDTIMYDYEYAKVHGLNVLIAMGIAALCEKYIDLIQTYDSDIEEVLLWLKANMRA